MVVPLTSAKRHRTRKNVSRCFYSFSGLFLFRIFSFLDFVFSELLDIFGSWLLLPFIRVVNTHPIGLQTETEIRMGWPGTFYGERP
jgi:hypothetical protein